MNCYHRRRTCSHTSLRRSPTMVTLHATRFVECRWSSASMIPAPGHLTHAPFDEDSLPAHKCGPPGVSYLCLTFVCWLLGCLTFQQHASVSQGRICSDKCMCCYTETVVADQTFFLTQSQYTETGPTSDSAYPITPGA